MKSLLRHIMTAFILLSVAVLASGKEPPDTPAATLNPTYQAEVISKTGADPYLLGLVGTVLLSVITLVVWVVRGNKKTIDKMIDGAEKRAAEDREMYRAEMRLERESHEKIVNAIVDTHRRDNEKIVTAVSDVADGLGEVTLRQGKLEKEVHELRGRLEG